MPIPRLVLWMFSTGMMVLAAGWVCGQGFPNKPIRIVTAQPGSGNDLVTRLIAPSMTASLGQQVIVDNRGLIAVEIVAKAPPDGYTLILYGTPLWLMPFMRDNVPWDPLKDFSPVTWATNAPNVLVVHPSLPAKSVAELIALAKARPGELNYGSGSTGSTSHLAAELFNQEMVRALNRAEVKERLFSAGVDVVASSPGELAAVIKSEMARLGKLIKDAGIRDQ